MVGPSIPCACSLESQRMGCQTAKEFADLVTLQAIELLSHQQPGPCLGLTYICSSNQDLDTVQYLILPQVQLL